MNQFLSTIELETTAKMEKFVAKKCEITGNIIKIYAPYGVEIENDRWMSVTITTRNRINGIEGFKMPTLTNLASPWYSTLGWYEIDVRIPIGQGTETKLETSKRKVYIPPATSFDVFASQIMTSTVPKKDQPFNAWFVHFTGGGSYDTLKFHVPVRD